MVLGLVNEGVYETLDYESTIEIHNKIGTRAAFSKRKKIRYLQDNIIAYQDYGWGDGEIMSLITLMKITPVVGSAMI